jgi:hypothetical protein
MQIWLDLVNGSLAACAASSCTRNQVGGGDPVGQIAGWVLYYNFLLGRIGKIALAGGLQYAGEGKAVVEESIAAANDSLGRLVFCAKGLREAEARSPVILVADVTL